PILYVIIFIPQKSVKNQKRANHKFDLTKTHDWHGTMWELEGWVGKWKTIQPRFARGNQPYPPFLETAPLGNPKTSLRLRKCCFRPA
ncbi:hypothetical protein, partial [uncultured Dialister sp.]